ncbi:MAG: FecR domain-containing protein [Lachnospiraceae bacterium]|nr:FecR domain-containing protein [Lachnospiraceae bacterium]
MTKKVWVMIGAVLAAMAVVVVVCVVLAGGKSETYRSIMVYQVNGSATITRAQVGEMEAYENLMLQSGDAVAVASDSSMRLKLDDDKYVLAEQDTLMNIVADGNDENARTYIDLQKGSVTSEIQNKLKAGASYEVNTPNSIMAVRGTIFRVDVEMDEDKNTNTRLTVFQGTVGVRKIMPDGSVSEEEIMVEAGNELTVEGTPTASEFSGEPAAIDYNSLPEIIQEYIEELAQSGMRQAETDEPEQQESDQQNLSAKSEDHPSNPSKASTKPQRIQSEPEQQDTQETKELEIEEEQQQETEQQKTEPQSQSRDSTPQTEPSSQPQQESEDEGNTKKQYYTVTFQYNGSTFGKQKVKKGEKATEPKLSPTENGAWDYDFSKKIEKNLVIQWKEN